MQIDIEAGDFSSHFLHYGVTIRSFEVTHRLHVSLRIGILQFVSNVQKKKGNQIALAKSYV